MTDTHVGQEIEALEVPKAVTNYQSRILAEINKAFAIPEHMNNADRPFASRTVQNMVVAEGEADAMALHDFGDRFGKTPYGYGCGVKASPSFISKEWKY